ncbi:cytochrome P450 [Nocardia vinacea]|uniref:Cytochrome P450 n=1 Tax=Nocardia vinacea TaxID=96468 RepID=A0ABZ1YXQ2_9NOCA|nr:cytochrome P450 [Nocardia vinacea]
MAGQAPQRVQIWNGQTGWLITKHEQVRALFADPRVSHDTSNASYPHESAGFMQRARQGQSFVNMDDPEHARMRRMVNSSFTAKRVLGLREKIQHQIDSLIDSMLAGPKPVDLVEAFSLAVPTGMICLLLGVPDSRQGFVQRAAETIIRQDTPPEVVQQVQGEFLDYLEDLVRQKAEDPGEDLLSDLAMKNVANGDLTAREAAVTARLLLVAGHETTANTISLSTALLLQHPEQLAELSDSDGLDLWSSAVEEFLRYESIAHIGLRRFALEDIELDGMTIRKGDGLMLSVDGGNRSPEVYENPDTLDLHRNPRGHLAFGWGPHQCIGQSLARLELKLALSTLFTRIPTLRLATTIDELDFKHDAIVYGLHSLPVTW